MLRLAQPPHPLQDVAYYFKPQVPCTVTISLCSSQELPATFDSQLFVLQDVDSGGSLSMLACNDDGCGTGSKLSQLTVGATGADRAGECTNQRKNGRGSSLGREAGSSWFLVRDMHPERRKIMATTFFMQACRCKPGQDLQRGQ